MPRAWVTSPDYDLTVRIIIAARQARGLSQRDLAAKLTKPRSFVSKYETKDRRLDIVEFVAIARALDIPPEEMFRDVLATLPEAISI